MFIDIFRRLYIYVYIIVCIYLIFELHNLNIGVITSLASGSLSTELGDLAILAHKHAKGNGNIRFALVVAIVLHDNPILACTISRSTVSMYT